MTPNQPVACPLSDRDIRWTLDGATPWPLVQPVFDLAIEALPAIDDDIARDIIAHMAQAIADLREELAVVRAILSAALTHAHAQHLEITRLREALSALHDARRAERRAA